VKIHGDYLDARIRNTPAELAAYDPPLDQLLDRVFDEYGLVVCGWSADWDPALRGAIERCASHRFTTYWATRGEPGELGHELLALRRGVVVSIADADSFFSSLGEKVAALARVDAPHPLSPRLAAETLKRYLPEERQRIRVYDLIADEVTAVEQATSGDAFPFQGEQPTRDSMLLRLERYESISATLVKLLAVGGYWGGPEHHELWAAVLDRLSNRSTELSGLETWLRLRHYPTVLALYGLGLGAVAAGKLDTLAAVLGRVTVREYNEQTPLAWEVAVARVVEEGHLQPEGKTFHTPASDRLSDVVMREPLREFLPNDQRYLDTFDRFEYLLSLAFADTSERRGGVWAPVGSFGWRHRRRDDNVYETVATEARNAGDGWAFLGDGLFDGSIERFLEIKADFDQQARKLPW
jgi:hypothetical protein